VKAIVYPRYGGPEVLEFREVPTPAPAERQVLVRLRAASVNPVDFHLMRGHVRLMTGLTRPRTPVLGTDFAGVVEAVGSGVTRFQTGDEVFGALSFGGGFAELVCTTDERLALKPPNTSFEQVAAVPVAGITALQGLRENGRIQAGQKVLIDGASGGVGTFAIQIAKALGAEVTAVTSTGKLEIARSLGADHVIDYTHEDFAKSGQRYDLVLGANSHHPMSDYVRALTPKGIFVGAGGGGSMLSALTPLVVGPLLTLGGRKRVRFFIARIDTGSLNDMADLLRTGKVAPFIDRTYPLGDAAAALRYLEEGHARGKVVLTVPA
jgi:NADPH:quinone reductase-like Zn-dependent oxidoreductase